MTDGDKNQESASQVEAARKAFEQEFERFARFTGGAATSKNLSLDQAETEIGRASCRERVYVLV